MFNYFKKWLSIFLTLILFFISSILELISGQNRVIVIVIDGARWTETFGVTGTTYTPRMDSLKNAGAVYTKFYNTGLAETCAGHTSIETGTWQTILNNGSQRSTFPTVFEYLRKSTGDIGFVVTGKSKLNILDYSTHSEYGITYKGIWDGDDNRNDEGTFTKVLSAMSSQPKLLVINFAEVDNIAHMGNFPNYTEAITRVDDLIAEIWLRVKLGYDGYSVTNTTMFVTNDHGRHTDNFANHGGDNCEGCQHIMLLAIGKNITPQINNTLTYQIDLAPTIGVLLGFTTPLATGTSLFDYTQPLPVELSSFSASLIGSSVRLSWRTETEVNNYGFDLERAVISNVVRNLIWEKIGFINGNGNSNSAKNYSFIDSNPIGGSKFQYRLKQIDNDGQYEYSKTIEIDFNSPKIFGLSQNYPNPFNPKTTLRFSLPESGNVKLTLFNSIGQEIKTIVKEYKESGMHTINFDASELNSGMYIYKLESGSFVQTRKMILLK
jgi:hypothetical protein